MSGDLIGWFILPESAEDYSGNWHVLLSILKHRQNILDLVSKLILEKTNITLFKKAIDRRISVIQSVIDIIDSYELPKSGMLSMIFSLWNNEEVKQGIEQVDEDSDDFEIAGKLKKARNSLLDSLAGLPQDHCKIIFFNKNIDKKDIIMYGLEDSEEKNIKLCVEVGDRIYANDVIAKEKYSYSGGKSIRSNATGIVREILIDEESKVSNGTILLRVETFSSHSTASFVQEEISKFYQKIKSFF